MNDVTFRVNKGDRVGVVGPNGSGKSTLFKIVLGEMFTDTGELVIENDPRIGWTRQNPEPDHPEETLSNFIAWYKEYGYRIWPMIDVYLEALGVYDAIDEQLETVKAMLSELDAHILAQIAALKAALKDASDELRAQIEAEIEALYEQLMAFLKANISAKYVVGPNSYYVALGDAGAYGPAADKLAAELGIEVEMNYIYGGQFFGDANITAKMDGWYSNGTEIVFACGGGIYTSVVDAAMKVEGAKVIGVDVDQAGVIANYAGMEDTSLTITSAMKGLYRRCCRYGRRQVPDRPFRYEGSVSHHRGYPD